MGLLVSSLWRRLFSFQEFKVCVVGLDNAGKTTILFQLHMGEVVETQPTIGSNVEEVMHKNVKFMMWDLGGQDSLRAGWRTYFHGTHAVVVVVDSTDRQRIGLVRDELWRMMQHAELSTACFLVFANKQDQMKKGGGDNGAAASAGDGSSEGASTDSAGDAANSNGSGVTSSSSPGLASSSGSGCMSAAEIAEQLNLQAIKTHPWHIQACCALTGEGLREGIEWITQTVTKA